MQLPPYHAQFSERSTANPLLLKVQSAIINIISCVNLTSTLSESIIMSNKKYQLIDTLKYLEYADVYVQPEKAITRERLNFYIDSGNKE